MKSFSAAKIVGLALYMSGLPLVTMMTGCAGDRYHQSTGENDRRQKRVHACKKRFI